MECASFDWSLKHRLSLSSSQVVPTATLLPPGWTMNAVVSSAFVLAKDVQHPCCGRCTDGRRSRFVADPKHNRYARLVFLRPEPQQLASHSSGHRFLWRGDMRWPLPTAICRPKVSMKDRGHPFQSNPLPSEGRNPPPQPLNVRRGQGLGTVRQPVRSDSMALWLTDWFAF